MSTTSRGPHRRHDALLLFSFAFTVLSFVATMLFVRSRARGISAAAESIASAVPSGDLLSDMRTALRHMEITLDDHIDGVVRGQPAIRGAQEIRNQQEDLNASWRRYVLLPADQAEREAQPAIARELAGLNRSIDETFRWVGLADGARAEQVMNNQAKPAVDRVDEGLRHAAARHARNSSRLGQKIMTTRRSVRAMANRLDVLCAAFAAVAAFAVLRSGRRYRRLMEFRVEELEHFAGRVAHDIRSPLAAVGLALDVGGRSQGVEPRVEAILAKASKTLQRVGQLVDGLLMFARAGAVPIEAGEAEVREILESVMEEMRPAAQARAIDLRLEAADPARVASNQGMVISITSNLIGNAIKFMKDSVVRRVVVRVRAYDSVVRLEVQDTGPGIAQEMQDRIFDPYVRAADAAIPGIGLGLSTVRRLVNAHGGSVGVDSNLGHGSLFWVELPKVATKPHALEARHPA